MKIQTISRIALFSVIVVVIVVVMNIQKKAGEAEVSSNERRVDKSESTPRRMSEKLSPEQREQIRLEARELVAKEFPHMMKPEKNRIAAAKWMREWDEYYKIHDPELANNPGRAIIYARKYQAEVDEANRLQAEANKKQAEARAQARYEYESSPQYQIDLLKQQIAQQNQQIALQNQAYHADNARREQEAYEREKRAQMESHMRKAREDSERLMRESLED